MTLALLSPHIAFIEGVGGPELMMILFVVLLLFGGEKLPEFARGLGKTMREFRKAASNVEDEFKRAIDDVERNAAIDINLDDPPSPTRTPAQRATRVPLPQHATSQPEVTPAKPADNAATEANSDK